MAVTVGQAPRLIVLFDRDCGICQASARALGRWDRGDRLELLALQEAPDSARAAVAAVAGANPLAAELHVLDPATGRVDRGGDAALAIAEALPGGSIVKPLRVIAPFRWVVGLLYDAVARNRHAIGRRLGVEGPACDAPR